MYVIPASITDANKCLIHVATYRLRHHTGHHMHSIQRARQNITTISIRCRTHMCQRPSRRSKGSGWCTADTPVAQILRKNWQFTHSKPHHSTPPLTQTIIKRPTITTRLLGTATRARTHTPYQVPSPSIESSLHSNTLLVRIITWTSFRASKARLEI